MSKHAIEKYTPLCFTKLHESSSQTTEAIANPVFLSDSFASVPLEGGASWNDSDRNSIRFNLSEVSLDSESNYFEAIIDISENEPSILSKSGDVEAFNISDREMIEIGILLSNIINDAEHFAEG